MSTVAAVGLATLAGAGILPAAAEPGAGQLAANHLVSGPGAARGANNINWLGQDGLAR